MTHETGFLSDPIVWYALALVLFLGIAWWKIRGPMLGWLDGEIAKVAGELEQAKKLRAEADAVLADYTERQRVALEEADAIVAHAQEEAARLRATAEQDLKAALERCEQRAMQRIRIAEAEALAAVRRAVVDQAVAGAVAALTAKLDDAASAKLMDQAIAEVPHLMPAAAKTA